MPSGPKVPKPPDPMNTANVQAQFNLDALRSNQASQMIGQNTPYGNLGYSVSGQDSYGNDMFTATSTMSPEQQAILANLQNTQTSLGGAASNLANDASNMYSSAPDFSEAAGTQTRTNMERQLGYLTPFHTQATEQLDNQLRNQGLMPGTVAYDRAMRTLRDNQQQSVGNFLNQAQPIAFQQAQAQYNQPMQTIQGLLGMSQPQGLPNQFVNTPRVSMNPADFTTAQGQATQAQMQAYQAKLAQYNAMMTGIFGVGSAVVGAPPGSMGARIGNMFS